MIARRPHCCAVMIAAALLAACAPERIPESPINRGGVGIAFHEELATRVVAGAGRSAKTGVSYGGGSSNTRSSASDSALAPAVRQPKSACEWFDPSASERAMTTRGVARGKGAGQEGWFAANCTSADELR